LKSTFLANNTPVSYYLIEMKWHFPKDIMEAAVVFSLCYFLYDCVFAVFIEYLLIIA